MWACQRVLLVLLLINPLLLLVCLCVLSRCIILLRGLMIVYHCARRFIFRPSKWLIFRPSVRPSVCLSVCMFTCTFVETNVLVYELWTLKIELTWLIPCLAWVFTGHTFHLVVVFVLAFFFVSRFKRRHCRYVHHFMQKLCLRSPKKYTYICER